MNLPQPSPFEFIKYDEETPYTAPLPIKHITGTFYMRVMEAEWFANPNWWFGCSKETDLYLSEEYGYLLDDCSKSTNIEKILVYDQLPRHVYRDQCASHIISWFLQKALEIVELIDIESLDDAQFCFMLLPLRHTNDIGNIRRVLDIAWRRLSTRVCGDVIRNFIKATYRKHPLQAAEFALPCEAFNESILEYNPKAKLNNLISVNPPKKKLIMSLSGGVDSMLCSWLLKSYDVIALHINYGNRVTANDEEEFVRWWCGKLGIPCYVRRIHEIRRDICMKHNMRDLYESYTRNVRYSCYKQFGSDVLVVLGHNKDDILENIFTNIAHKTKYENLNGMQEFSTVDGISFWRPLLDKTKDDIISLARAIGIPHLPNSTPPWSQRGQIRASVVPVLEKWNEFFIDGLHGLSNEMRGLYGILDMYVNDFMKFVKVSDGCIYLTKPCDMHCQAFWMCLFSKLGIRPSHKSIENMMQAVKRRTKKIQLTKDWQVVLI
jgi:tRNA(Ile)-lysidine synthetase-like protein